VTNVVLSPEEFAYLLAVVHAPLLVGVSDARLFPQSGKARKSVYEKGRKLLEANGWLKALEDAPGEYEFDAGLMEIVASVADPDFVIGVLRRGADGKYVGILDYLAANLIVEITLDVHGGYRLGTVPERAELFRRIGLILRLTTPDVWGQFDLDEPVFKEVLSFSQNGEGERATALLTAARQVSPAAAESFLKALSDPTGGMVVSLRPGRAGGAETGRKATVYGGFGSAWIVQKRARASVELEITSCDARRLEMLVTSWLGELANSAATVIRRPAPASE
jgi:hypothetical protein